MKSLRFKFDVSNPCDSERARGILLKRLEQKQPVGAIVNHVTGKLVLEWEEISESN
jgi:chemotaxis signal transduction protein